jgi:hypothetical protein
MIEEEKGWIRGMEEIKRIVEKKGGDYRGEK